MAPPANSKSERAPLKLLLGGGFFPHTVEDEILFTQDYICVKKAGVGPNTQSHRKGSHIALESPLNIVAASICSV